MKNKQNEQQFRQIGKGFVLNHMEGIVGRILTHAYLGQDKQTYVKINGEFIRLTEQHSYLAVS